MSTTPTEAGPETAAAANRGHIEMINRAHFSTAQALADTAQHAISVGTLLLTAKAKLGPRKFPRWADAGCRMSRADRNRYIRAAKFAVGAGRVGRDGKLLTDAGKLDANVKEILRIMGPTLHPKPPRHARRRRGPRPLPGQMDLPFPEAAPE